MTPMGGEYEWGSYDFRYVLAVGMRFLLNGGTTHWAYYFLAFLFTEPQVRVGTQRCAHPPKKHPPMFFFAREKWEWTKRAWGFKHFRVGPWLSHQLFWCAQQQNSWCRSTPMSAFQKTRSQLFRDFFWWLGFFSGKVYFFFLQWWNRRATGEMIVLVGQSFDGFTTQISPHKNKKKSSRQSGVWVVF